MIPRHAALAASVTVALLQGPPAMAADDPSVPAPVFKAGQTWVYDATVEQGTTGFIENHYVVRVEEVRDDTVIVGVKRQGAPTAFQDHAFGLDWSERLLENGTPITGEQPYKFPLVVGKTWVVDYDDPVRHGLQTATHVHKTFKVVGWEDVKTPAGLFHALRIEGNGTLKAQIAASVGGVSGVAATSGAASTITHVQNTPAHVEYATTYGVTDYAPQVGSFVKTVHETYNAAGVRIRRETRMLESYAPSS